ncbi:4'-phosphopantetheinyl transferase [Paenibacillus sp. CCS19]|uniref:4'-phosphopantetheinyl transferase family protein n=1 Tax=Paenibacillus sp. CCS19 TaxID=3158387 RepID=UPI002563506E|nr:4'-phosphopantetheinyl transferase superfamily protein [Paenibacillus cellulosilyticus]GMK38601.1 4'-phosphopantetheinyl transferase [Paenibacillus cellulosilyticus]
MGHPTGVEIGIEINAVRIPKEIDGNLFLSLLPLVSEEKRRRIERFVYREDALRALLGEMLVRRIIQTKLGLSNDEIRFKRNRYGKPFLENCEDCYFNISHSGEWVVGVIHSKPIGIDVEQIQTIDLEIAQRFFAEEEYRAMQNRPDIERQSFFYDMWTLKESYMKAIGKGLSVPLDSFSIQIVSKDEIRLTEGEKAANYHFKQYDIDPGYKLSVCAESDRFPSRVTMLDWREVC